MRESIHPRLYPHIADVVSSIYLSIHPSIFCVCVCVCVCVSGVLSQGICKDYITATLLEQTRREQFKEDAVRNVELSAYLTHCKMQPLHMLISLRQAMTSSVKLVKNYNTAAGFARRLLELNPKAEHKEMALKVRRPFTLSISLASFLIHTL